MELSGYEAGVLTQAVTSIKAIIKDAPVLHEKVWFSLCSTIFKCEAPYKVYSHIVPYIRFSLSGTIFKCESPYKSTHILLLT